MVQSFGEFIQAEPEDSDELEDNFPFDVRFECKTTLKSDIKKLGYELERTYKDGDYEIYNIIKDGNKEANMTVWLSKGSPEEALIEEPVLDQ